MAKGTLVAVFGTSSILTALACLVSAFLSTKITRLVCSQQTTQRSVRVDSRGEQTESDRSPSSPSRKSRDHGRSRSKGYLSKVASVMCSWLFTFYLALRCVLSAVMFDDFLQSNHRANEEYDRIKKQSYFRISASLSLVWIGGCYGLMSTICFHRLCDIFSDTQYRLNVWTVRTLRSMIVVSSVSAGIGAALWPWISGPILFILLFPGMVAYPFTLVYTCLSLFHLTGEISSNMKSMLQIHSQSNSLNLSSSVVAVESADHRRDTQTNPMNDSVMQKVRSLTNASLRLTVVTVVVILSSLLMISVTVIYAFTIHPIFLLMMHISVCFDCSLNIFAIMCAFKDFETEYLMVFGRLHHYWLERLVNG